MHYRHTLLRVEVSTSLLLPSLSLSLSLSHTHTHTHTRREDLNQNEKILPFVSPSAFPQLRDISVRAQCSSEDTNAFLGEWTLWTPTDLGTSRLESIDLRVKFQSSDNLWRFVNLIPHSTTITFIFPNFKLDDLDREAALMKTAIRRLVPNLQAIGMYPWDLDDPRFFGNRADKRSIYLLSQCKSLNWGHIYVGDIVECVDAIQRVCSHCAKLRELHIYCPAVSHVKITSVVDRLQTDQFEIKWSLYKNMKRIGLLSVFRRS